MTGVPWSEEEIRATIAAYFDLLAVQKSAERPFAGRVVRVSYRLTDGQERAAATDTDRPIALCVRRPYSFHTSQKTSKFFTSMPSLRQ